jgi:hypothetical protein
MARRYRKSDLVRQLLHGGSAVVLENAEDFPVNRVQRLHWNKLTLRGVELVSYPNLHRPVATN